MPITLQPWTIFFVSLRSVGLPLADRLKKYLRPGKLMLAGWVWFCVWILAQPPGR